jgi:hypothetical protein
MSEEGTGRCAKEIADVARGNGLAVVAYRRRGGHLDDLEHRHAEKRRACLATATGTDRSTYDHACKPGVHGRVTQAGECSGYVQKPVTRRRLKIYVEEKQRLACSSTLDFAVGFHSRHASIRAEAGVRKRFCQAVIQQAIFAGMTYHRSAVREGLLFWTDLPGAGNDMYPELPPTTPATRR